MHDYSTTKGLNDDEVNLQIPLELSLWGVAALLTEVGSNIGWIAVLSDPNFGDLSAGLNPNQETETVQ